MWEDIINLFKKFIEIIEVIFLYEDFVSKIVFFLGIIIAIIGSKVRKKWDIYNRKKFLSLNYKYCLITGDSSKHRWFETFEVMGLMRNIQVYKWIIEKILEIGVKPIVSGESLLTSIEYDEILFEGPAANPKVDFYIRTYFKNVKYYVNLDEFFNPEKKTEKYTRQYQNRIKKMSYIEDTKDYYGFSVGNKKLEMKSGETDYAILIKMVPSDFRAVDKGKTVHILFGWSLAGSRKSVEYFLKHYKKIYKRFKNNHYFIAVEINKNDNEYINEEYIDLTNKI